MSPSHRVGIFLSARLPTSKVLATVILGLALVLLIGGHLWIGLRTDFLPCTLDCGETYEAYVAARNLVRFGWAMSGGLFDFATSPEPAAHPMLYTHNPTLGHFVLAGLFALGIRDVHAETAWLTVPFLLGMLYLYLAVWRVTGSRLLAGLCLLNASSLYLLVALWGFHADRVWSWMLTWGVTYHLKAWGERKNSLHLCLVILYLAVSFAIDYPFALFLGSLVIALSAVGVVAIPLRRALGVVTLSIGLPVLLRQLQVAAVIGRVAWSQDVWYSLLRRVPLLTLLWPAPIGATLSEFAQTHHLIFWPGGGTFMPLTWFWILGRAYLGVLGLGLLVVLAAWVIALRFRHADGPVAAGLRLSLAVALALGATFAVFGEYVTSFYGVYLMPLVVHWIVLLLGLTSAVLVAHWRAPLGVGLLMGFLVWRGATEASNITALPPVGYPAREALMALQGHSVATFWISSAASAYTDQWAASLLTMRWLDGRHLRFDPAHDYYTFMERDRDNPRYQTPDFLLLPRLRAWGLTRRCAPPLGGAISALADGCTDLESLAALVGQRLPLARRGPDYLLYDLRPALK